MISIYIKMIVYTRYLCMYVYLFNKIMFNKLNNISQ